MKSADTQACPICPSYHHYTPEQIIRSQASTYNRLSRLIKNLTRRQLSFRPAPHKWSIKELISHLCDTEIAYSYRYRKVLCEDYPFLSGYDQALWAKEMSYSKQDIKLPLETFKLLRLNNVNLMKLTNGRKWGKVGMHEEYGRISLRQMLAHITDHDHNHLHQITAIRSLLKKREL